MAGNILDITGQRFGMLTALSRLSETKDRYYLWECVCDCGKRALASTRQLKRGVITNCGCIPKTVRRHGPRAEDIAGQRFGKLTAVSQAESKGGKTRWQCICDCGATVIARTSLLKLGRMHHCGCETNRKKDGSQLELTGGRFGRLVAIEATEKRGAKGSVVWLCKCDCGNAAEVSADALMHGKTVSCGCRKKELKENIGKNLTFVESTCVEWIRSRKNRSDNTSGFRGVYEYNGKFRAHIDFQRKRYHCGTFDSFEEAKSARLEYEKILHDAFVRAWDTWSAIAKTDPGWAQKFPFIFRVYKENGKIKTYTPILCED